MRLSDRVENLIHSLRYHEVFRYVRPCKRLGDMGSGDRPRFLLRAASLAGERWGVDFNAIPLEEGTLHVQRGDVTKRLPFEDRFFDQMTCLAVIEHVDEPKLILAECLRCLEPGGRLVLTTPSKLGIHVHEVLRKTRLIRDVREGEHRDFDLWPSRLAGWAREVGFEVEACHCFELFMNVILVARKPAA